MIDPAPPQSQPISELPTARHPAATGPASRRSVQAAWIAALFLLAAAPACRLLEPSPAPKEQAASPAPPAPDPITSLPVTELSAILYSRDPSSLIGQAVQLTGVNVFSLVTPAGFWIGDHGESLFAVPQASLNGAPFRLSLHRGSRVNISGTLHLPYDLPVHFQDRLNVDQLGHIRFSGIWVLADEITPAR